MPSSNFWLPISTHGEIIRKFSILKPPNESLGLGDLLDWTPKLAPSTSNYSEKPQFGNTLSPRLATLARPNTATRRQWDTHFLEPIGKPKRPDVTWREL